MTIYVAAVYAVIPGRSNRKKPIIHDRTLYKGRNRIERMFVHIKINRAVAARHDQLAESFLSMIQIAATYLLNSSRGLLSSDGVHHKVEIFSCKICSMGLQLIDEVFDKRPMPTDELPLLPEPTASVPQVPYRGIRG